MTYRLNRRLCAALERSLDGEKVRPPEGSAPLWNCFMALSRARSCGPAGPNPIAYSEIAAWAQLTRTPLEPHHVEIITAMDEVWMQRAYQRSDAPDGVPVLKPRSEQAITPAMFDLTVG